MPASSSATAPWPSPGAGSLARGNFPGTITNYANFTYNSSASQVFSGAISNSGTITVGSPAFVQIMAPISGPGTLVQNGPGTTLLYSNNSYTGLTTINGGKLVGFLLPDQHQSRYGQRRRRLGVECQRPLGHRFLAFHPQRGQQRGSNRPVRAQEHDRGAALSSHPKPHRQQRL